jgi:hypothetical protein
MNKTEFGTFIKEQYPQLFDKKLEKDSLFVFKLMADSQCFSIIIKDLSEMLNQLD